MDKATFDQLGLSSELLAALSELGFEQATPIQSRAIPVLLSGRDVIGQSQTGSGKTAAFAIPAIELVDSKLAAPQVLILCPTRELAIQVAEDVARLAKFKKGVREIPLYGGASYERQFRALDAGAQIVIGTPGRIMDHLKRGSFRPGQLRMVILDEADRMLDMGFQDDIRAILSRTPENRQTVLFSATYPRGIRELVDTFTRSPEFIRIEGRSIDAPAIDQVYYEINRRSKTDVLCRIIDLHEISYAIIFCSTKMMVDELTEHLVARGYAAEKMHGDMSQTMRERVMERFRKRAVEFLVATDVAARGLDVEDVEVVFNYDLPHDGEDYVHRIGRTGRAGRSGKAISLVGGRDTYRLQNIMRFLKAKIRREPVPTVEQLEEKRANDLFESLRARLEAADYERFDSWVDRLLDQGYSPTDMVSALLHLLSKERHPEPVCPDPQPEPDSARSERCGRDRRAAFWNKRERLSRPRAGDDPRYRSWPKKNSQIDRPKRSRREAPSPLGEKVPWSQMPQPEARRPVSPRRVRETGMTEIILGAGTKHGVEVGDILGVILGAGRVRQEDVGAIRLHAKQALVDVRCEVADALIQKLEGIELKNRVLWVKKGK